MAGKLITMGKVKQILQLSEQGVSQREISRRLNVNRKTIVHYLAKTEELNFSKEDLLTMPDIKLESLFLQRPVFPETNEEYQYLESLFPYFKKELKKTGVSRYVLWGEYRSNRPGGYGYSQMCYHYQQWLISQKISMRMAHDYGEEMFIDFTGSKLRYFCPHLNAVAEAEVLVSILGGSQFHYVEATRSQRIEDFVGGVSNSIHYFGGVPKVLIPDNLKSGVITASNYQPVLTETFLSMANHYKTTVCPARPTHPQDKALVESIINLVYSEIFAPLRNQLPHGIDGLNEEIRRLLPNANKRNFQNRDYSRLDLFEDYEKETLRPITMDRYEITQSYKLRVDKFYHVYFNKDKHSYSVPYKYAHKRVKAVTTPTMISIYYNGIQIASHIRSKEVNGTTTHLEHMHPSHKYVQQWEPSQAYQWGADVDPIVEQYLQNMISQCSYPHMARRMFEGVKDLNKRYGNQRLVNACRRALGFNASDYTTLKNILSNKIDLLGQSNTATVVTLPRHENIRGSKYYY